MCARPASRPSTAASRAIPTWPEPSHCARRWCASSSATTELRFDPEQIQVGCGAKQILYNALQATIDPGDEVVVPTPAWVSYPEMVLLAERLAIDRPLRRCASNFKLTAATAGGNHHAARKWLMLNSPSNPSGAVYSHDELAALGAVLLRHPRVLGDGGRHLREDPLPPDRRL